MKQFMFWQAKNVKNESYLNTITYSYYHKNDWTHGGMILLTEERGEQPLETQVKIPEKTRAKDRRTN